VCLVPNLLLPTDFTIEKETKHKITKLITETWVFGFTHKKSIYTQR